MESESLVPLLPFEAKASADFALRHLQMLRCITPWLVSWSFRHGADWVALAVGLGMLFECGRLLSVVFVAVPGCLFRVDFVNLCMQIVTST